ncbi:MAG: phenylalanine--tRNA ligase subunit beta, partial [Candidatus Dadabacteria bacterium]|nr:phenylalanine--tRNA ligase subunit beta [Candidatus Dadabacteria bacterium]
KLSGGQVAKGRIDEYPVTIEPSLVRLSLNRVNSILGTAIDAGEITRISEGLGFEMAASSNGEITFRIPTWRVDVTREIDLIEEIARLYGYGRIPSTLPAVTMKTEVIDPAKIAVRRFKEIFVSGGFSEAINFSFEDYELLTLFGKTGALGILNPLSSELAAMRTSLLPGLIRNSVLNLNRQEQNVRLFEIGKVFIPTGKGQLPVEITKLAAAATGRRQPELWDKEEFDFYDFKNLLDKGFDALSISGSVRFRMATEIGFLHPGKSAVITAGDEDCGFIGELHPDLSDKLEISKRLYVMELDLDKIAGKFGETRKVFTQLPRFPAVRRDIALIIDEETPVSSILEEIHSLDSKLIEDAEVFDVFTGSPVEKGKKSVAVSLQLRALDKTLTEEEINKVQEKTIKKLQLALGADLRTI